MRILIEHDGDIFATTINGAILYRKAIDAGFDFRTSRYISVKGEKVLDELEQKLSGKEDFAEYLVNQKDHLVSANAEKLFREFREKVIF